MSARRGAKWGAYRWRFTVEDQTNMPGLVCLVMLCVGFSGLQMKEIGVEVGGGRCVVFTWLWFGRALDKGI